MAKSIRSIKNTLCDDEKLGALSRDARLLFIGLITRADDHGRFRSHAAVVRGQVFPYDDDLTVGDVERLLQELAAADRIVLYTAGGQRYGHIPTWATHQRVDNASKSELPDPPAANCGELPLGPGGGDPPPGQPSEPSEPVDNGSRCVTAGVENVDGESMRRTAANCGELPLDRRGRDISTHVVCQGGVGGDDDDEPSSTTAQLTATAACHLLGQRRHAEARAADAINDRTNRGIRSHLRACQRNAVTEHGAQAQVIALAHPDWTPDQVADELERLDAQAAHPAGTNGLATVHPIGPIPPDPEWLASRPLCACEMPLGHAGNCAEPWRAQP